MLKKKVIYLILVLNLIISIHFVGSISSLINNFLIPPYGLKMPAVEFFLVPSEKLFSINDRQFIDNLYETIKNEDIAFLADSVNLGIGIYDPKNLISGLYDIHNKKIDVSDTSVMYVNAMVADMKDYSVEHLEKSTGLKSKGMYDKKNPLSHTDSKYVYNYFTSPFMSNYYYVSGNELTINKFENVFIRNGLTLTKYIYPGSSMGSILNLISKSTMGLIAVVTMFTSYITIYLFLKVDYAKLKNEYTITKISGINTKTFILQKLKSVNAFIFVGSIISILLYMFLWNDTVGYSLFGICFLIFNGLFIITINFLTLYQNLRYFSKRSYYESI